MKENLLISACLCGYNTKYDGTNNLIKDIDLLKEKYNLIIICPEVSGGLSIPRDPSEIYSDKVISSNNKDVTINFNKGALISLNKALKYNCRKALLKDGSPSCGVNYIYDGTFTKNKINNFGVTSKLFIKYNIELYTEKNYELLLK